MKEKNFDDDIFSSPAHSLRGLLAGRADEHELFFIDDDGVCAESKGGVVDSLKAHRGHGVGVRVISDGRPGFAFSSDFERASLEAVVKNALAASHDTDRDEFLSVPEGGSIASAIERSALYDDFYRPGQSEAAIEGAVLVEKGAMDFSDEVVRVRKASYEAHRLRTRVLNSKGVDASHSATFYTTHVTAIAERAGEAQMGWDMALDHLGSKIEPHEAGRNAAIRAVRMLGARSIASERLPAVLENTVVCELLEVLSGSFLGDNLAKGKSMLRDKVGKKVFSPIVNIRDDGTMRGGWSTSSSDAEGLPAQNTALVTEGVLRGYLFDSYWAGKMKSASTGNATRSGYTDTPGVGLTNLYMEVPAGAGGIEDLFSEAGRGLFITELLGVHTINPVTGDFSLGASGVWIEGGRLSYPVRGLAIAGNLLGLFGKVIASASDMRFLGSIGAPSILINELEASGS